jgi:transcriptional regulator with XRE-family HTH domain
MTQKQLGDAIGKAQTWISVLEDPEYGKMSVATLLSLADAFGTDLEIKFRPFSRSLHELTRQGSEYFQVRSFDEELPDLESAATLQWIIPNGRWSDTLRAVRLLTETETAPRESLINVTSAPSASGAMQGEMQVPVGSYVQAPILMMGPRITVSGSPTMPRKIQSALRSRRQIRLTRKDEAIWRKKKHTKRQDSSNKSNRFSGGGKTMNPYTQIMFSFNQASGT